MKNWMKILIVFLSVSAFVACQDEDFTEPSDTSTGTDGADADDFLNPDEGSYTGLPQILDPGAV